MLNIFGLSFNLAFIFILYISHAYVKVGEVGELSEIFQWRGEVDRGLPNWEESDKEHLGEELSDVLLYLIRLADICGIDLADAASKKIVKNAIKYPTQTPIKN
jgi:dCTP diphosphatase